MARIRITFADLERDTRDLPIGEATKYLKRIAPLADAVFLAKHTPEDSRLAKVIEQQIAAIVGGRKPDTSITDLRNRWRRFTAPWPVLTRE